MNSRPALDAEVEIYLLSAIEYYALSFIIVAQGISYAAGPARQNFLLYEEMLVSGLRNCIVMMQHYSCTICRHGIWFSGICSLPSRMRKGKKGALFEFHRSVMFSLLKAALLRRVLLYLACESGGGAPRPQGTLYARNDGFSDGKIHSVSPPHSCAHGKLGVGLLLRHKPDLCCNVPK